MSFKEVLQELVHESSAVGKIVDLLHHTEEGSVRRQDILGVLKSGVRIPVNRRGCRKVSLDKDMKKLIKRGEAEVISVYTSVNSKVQYLVVKE